MKNWKKIGKGAAFVLVPTVLVAGYYVVDRVFIKKVPLLPLSLQKAKEKKANNAMSTATKKLDGMIQSGEINGFGVVYDESEYGKNPVIEITASSVTSDLRNKIPPSVDGVEIKWRERPMAKAQ